RLGVVEETASLAAPVALPIRGGDNDTPALLPVLDALGHEDRRGVRGGLTFELYPGAGDRRAVKLHAPTTADDGRARLPVHALDVMQADQRCVLRGDRLGGSADQQRRASLALGQRPGTSMAVEALLTGLFAGGDGEEADFQARVAVTGELQCACDL